MFFSVYWKKTIDFLSLDNSGYVGTLNLSHYTDEWYSACPSRLTDKQNARETSVPDSVMCILTYPIPVTLVSRLMATLVSSARIFSSFCSLPVAKISSIFLPILSPTPFYGSIFMRTQWWTQWWREKYFFSLIYNLFEKYSPVSVRLCHWLFYLDV